MTATVGHSAGAVESAITDRLALWEDIRFGPRLWERDPTLWFDPAREEITDRLGWLDLPEASRALVAPIEQLTTEVVGSGIEHVVLLGMGGSSLAPEVFHSTFGARAGHPALRVLDSTHPAAVLGTAGDASPRTTLYVVASKSGTTLETSSFFHFFWHQLGAEVTDPGDHFVAITDPGTPLADLGAERAFRAVIEAPPDVGGRFSALSPFGLVPAGLIGTDLRALLAHALAAARSCGPNVDARDNPGLVLGAALGELARSGSDKVTILAAPEVAGICAWIEQLFAESTGKDGTGLIPFSGESGPDYPGTGRVFLRITVAGSGPPAPHGMPTVQLDIASPVELGAAMYVLEIATAAAGSVLGVHPFDQPDVELAKTLARRTMAGETIDGDVVEITIDDPDHRDALRSRMASEPQGYVGIHAYLAPSAPTTAHLERFRRLVGNRLRMPTALDYGPRLLHSTGQLHKGGSPTGVFFQIVDHPQTALTVPETAFTFGDLIRAQAIGDHVALQQRGRRVTMVCLGDRGPAALPELIATVEGDG